MSRVAVLIGSLRRESYSRKVAQAIAGLTESLSYDFIDIGQLSYFNQDLESDPPADWVAFRERIAAADAVLFVTPEYVRSVPGVLKNAIDIGSRPYGKGVLIGKPSAVVSISPGGMGGFGANHHLRQALVSLNMPTLAQPEAYIGNAGSLFDESGKLANDNTKAFLTKFGQAFEGFIRKAAA